MNAVVATGTGEAERRDLRLQLLDDAWLLTIFAVLLAIGLPWAALGFEIDIGAAFWGVLALGAIHLALSAEPWMRHFSVRARRHLLTVLQLTGVIVMGVVWHYAGGTQNPVFLLAFALPVIGATFIGRWHPYLAAAVAVIVVAVVALVQTPELRWYVAGLGGAGAWLVAWLPTVTEVSAPFRGFYAPYAYAVVLLQVFAVLLFACAVAAEYLGTVFERLHQSVEQARAQALQGQQLWTTILQDLPAAALLVDADTRQIICASKHVAPVFAAPGARLAGNELLQAIRFSYPEVVQELLRGSGGAGRPGTVRVGEHIRLVTVRVQHLPYVGHRLALVLLEDFTQEFCAHTALDASEDATLVVDARGRIVAFDKQARELFAGTQFGSALQLLTTPGTGTPWWNAGLTGRRKLHVQVAGRICEVTTSVVPLPGEDESFHVIAFHPAAKGAAAQSVASGSSDSRNGFVELS